MIINGGAHGRTDRAHHHGRCSRCGLRRHHSTCAGLQQDLPALAQVLPQAGEETTEELGEGDAGLAGAYGTAGRKARLAGHLRHRAGHPSGRAVGSGQGSPMITLALLRLAYNKQMQDYLISRFNSFSLNTGGLMAENLI